MGRKQPAEGEGYGCETCSAPRCSKPVQNFQEPLLKAKECQTLLETTHQTAQHIPTVSFPRDIPWVWDIANDREKRGKEFFYFSVGKALKCTGIVQTNEAPRVPLGLAMCQVGQRLYVKWSFRKENLSFSCEKIGLPSIRVLCKNTQSAQRYHLMYKVITHLFKEYLLNKF